MQYDAFVTVDKSSDSFLIEFPDCQGCQTFADTSDEVQAVAKEALEGWLETHLAERRVPPRPADRDTAPRGATLISVNVNPRLAVGLHVRWARIERDLSQKGLAELVGVTQQQIARLEDPDGNPGLTTVERVAAALGLDVQLAFAPVRKFTPPRRTKKAG